MTQVDMPARPGRTIRQERSRRTYESLVATGFRLVESREFDSITVAEIAREAGYSVGAFYARFESRDEFFEAMVAKHVQERSRARTRILKSVAHEELVETLIRELVRYYWRRRRFWRAVLTRSANDPEFWEPINRNGVEFVAGLTRRIENDAGRSLTQAETDNVHFAVHMVLSMINNRIVNRPKPSLVHHATFIEELTRAFKLVAGYDRLSADPAVED